MVAAVVPEDVDCQSHKHQCEQTHHCNHQLALLFVRLKLDFLPLRGQVEVVHLNVKLVFHAHLYRVGCKLAVVEPFLGVRQFFHIVHGLLVVARFGEQLHRKPIDVDKCGSGVGRVA